MTTNACATGENVHSTGENVSPNVENPEPSATPTGEAPAAPRPSLPSESRALDRTPAGRVVCPGCGKDYANEHTLARHVASAHTS